MILTAFHGFCMALADSVPGVSGGTIAFILGFYERFLDALRNLFRGKGAERKSGFIYLCKLGVGWGIGMISCVMVLSSLFTRDIYFMSSLFLGLTISSIPFILAAEKATLKNSLRFCWFAVLGVAIVVGLTSLRSGTGALSTVNFTDLDVLQLVYIFFSGAVAITAMVLPGISGSSVLLIAGVYLPTIQAIDHLLRLQLNVLPGLCVLAMGIVAGIAVSVNAIRNALRKYRKQMLWLIIGLMLGSLYAIINGPTTMDSSLAPLSVGSFSFLAFVLGIAILLSLELIKKAVEKRHL